MRKLRMALFAVALVIPCPFFAASAFAEGFCTGLAPTKNVEMPIGKGRVPKFTVSIPQSWTIESARKAGDRWTLKDSRTKKPVAKFEFDLSNTDQKMLPIILESDLKIGKFSVSKVTVTTNPEAQDEEARAKITDGLITSYTFTSSKLEKLVLMSEEYDKASCLEAALEKIVGSIALK